MMMTTDQALVLFGRYPERGRAKTRLAATLGEEATLKLYQAMLADTAWKLGRTEDCRAIAALTGEREWTEPPPDPLGRDPFAHIERVAQHGDSFGARLAAAVQEGARRGAARTVLVGADSPELAAADLAQALRLLESRDVVLGPALDGGYYLIGLRVFEPGLFEGITWSTGAVLEETVRAASRLGLRTGLLGPLADVDVVTDLEGLAVRRRRAWEQGDTESPCPATDAWLRTVWEGLSGPTKR